MLPVGWTSELKNCTSTPGQVKEPTRASGAESELNVTGSGGTRRERYKEKAATISLQVGRFNKPHCDQLSVSLMCSDPVASKRNLISLNANTELSRAFTQLFFIT